MAIFCLDANREPLDAVEERRRLPRIFVLRELQVREALENLEQRHLRLEPRQRRADADMRAAAERHMRHRLARDVEAVRIVEQLAGSRFAAGSDVTIT